MTRQEQPEGTNDSAPTFHHERPAYQRHFFGSAGSWIVRLAVVSTSFAIGFVFGADSPYADRLLKEAEKDLLSQAQRIDPGSSFLNTKESNQHSISSSCLNPPKSTPVVGLAGLHSEGAVGFDLTGRVDNLPYRTLRQHDINFTYLRASRGISGHAKGYTDAWTALSQCDVSRGVIHEFTPIHSVEKQVDNLLGQTSGNFGELPPVIDVEKAHGTKRHECTKILPELLSFIDAVEAKAKRKVVIRTSGAFWDKTFNCAGVRGAPGTESIYERSLWVVDPGKETPQLPAGWTDWSIWQQSTKGRLGHERHVPVDRFNGSETKLLDWISDSKKG